MSWPLWDSGIKDLSPYDLSPAGAMRENDWVKDHPEVTYFSVTTNSSVRGLLTGWHYPSIDANPLISLFHGPGWMGNYLPDTRPFAPVDASSWWPSDGVVNTVAQKAPTWAMTAGGLVYARPVTVRDLSQGGTPQPGAWNWKGLMVDYDHFDIIGWTLFFDSVGWYKAHVDQLRSL
jgi:triacylglycerol lipase